MVVRANHPVGSRSAVIDRLCIIVVQRSGVWIMTPVRTWINHRGLRLILPSSTWGGDQRPHLLAVGPDEEDDRHDDEKVSGNAQPHDHPAELLVGQRRQTPES